MSVKKFNIRTLPYNLPSFVTPPVSFFKKKVRCHTHTNLLTALHLKTSVTILMKRIAKTRFCFVNICTVLATHTVKKIHIAILTTLAALYVTVPWIPNIMHKFSPLCLFHKYNKFKIADNSVLIFSVKSYISFSNLLIVLYFNIILISSSNFLTSLGSRRKYRGKLFQNCVNTTGQPHLRLFP